MNIVKLKNICERITKGATPTILGFSYIDNGINYFIKIEIINNYENFNKNKFAHISEQCNFSLSKSKLKENDILFSEQTEVAA